MQITVVWGPPASGKSTFVAEHRSDNSLTFDFDKVMQALSGLPPHHKNPSLIGLVLQIREVLVQALFTSLGVDDVWIITTRVKVGLMDALEGLDVQYHRMDTDKETCLERVASDPDRADVAEEMCSVIEEWFQEQAALEDNPGEYLPIDQLVHRLDRIKYWR